MSTREPRAVEEILLALAARERVSDEERELARQSLEAEHRPPPADLSAEAAVLSACFDGQGDPGELGLVLDILRPEQFCSEAHRRIFEAMLELHGRGEPIDLVTVRSWLRDHDRLQQVGGDEALVEIRHAAYGHTTAYARQVRDKWRLRQAFTLMRAAIAGAFGTDVALINEVHAELARLAPVTKRAGEAASTIVDAWAQQGPLERRPTGFSFLDERIKGGLAFGERLILNGAPDAAKTAIATWLGCQWARSGILVGILAVDEDEDAVVTRFAQMLGFTREECEARDRLILQDISRELAALPLVVFGHERTIEEAADQLANAAGDRGAALIVDSLQTATCASVAAIEAQGRSVDDRARVSANVRASRAVTKRHGRLLFVATSEMSRAGFAKKDERPTDMSASKGSSAIEYSARVMLTMRAVPHHDDLFSVSITKNKLGPKNVIFGIRLQRTHHRLEEATLPQEPDAKDDARADTKRRNELVEKVVQVVTMLPRKPHGKLRDAIRAAGGKGRNSEIDLAIAEAEHLGRILNAGTLNRAAYVAPSAPATGAVPTSNGVTL